MNRPDPTDEAPPFPRIFIFEPGWAITRKRSSDREFCYMMSPGQDYYHRLLDGEVYLVRGDEKVCFPCASRRGLLTHEPKSLREPMPGLNLAIDDLLAGGFDVLALEDRPRQD